MEIKVASEKDFDDVKKIVRTTIKTVYPKYYPAGAVQFFLDHHSDEKIRDDILNRKVFLLCDYGINVGTVSVSENEIGRLFVLPDFQHKGYGRTLLDFAEKKVSEISAKIILDASLPAKAIYRKRGYVESDYVITETGYGDYLCYDIMEKQSSINM